LCWRYSRRFAGEGNGRGCESTRGLVSGDEGSKLGGRVSTLEQAKVAEAAEKVQAKLAEAGGEGEKGWLHAQC
jgi:hypothetical protein